MGKTMFLPEKSLAKVRRCARLEEDGSQDGFQPRVGLRHLRVRSVPVSGSGTHHTVPELCVPSWQHPTSRSSLYQLKSWHGLGLRHGGAGGPFSSQLPPHWDIGWVTPVPASLPDRDAPACPRCHLRGHGALQRDFGLGTMLHMTGSFCLVPGQASCWSPHCSMPTNAQ